MKNNRDLIRKRAAAGNPEMRFLNHVLTQREQGITRQRTTAEIAAMYCVEHKAWKCSAH
jgi:hypothetical protein